MKTTKYQHFIRIIDLLLRGLFSHQIISFMSSGASDIVRIFIIWSDIEIGDFSG